MLERASKKDGLRCERMFDTVEEQEVFMQFVQTFEGIASDIDKLVNEEIPMMRKSLFGISQALQDRTVILDRNGERHGTV